MIKTIFEVGDIVELKTDKELMALMEKSESRLEDWKSDYGIQTGTPYIITALSNGDSEIQIKRKNSNVAPRWFYSKFFNFETEHINQKLNKIFG